MDYSKEQYYKMQQKLASQAYTVADYGQKMPFYMAHPVQNLYMTEIEYEKEMERMKDLYPSEAKRLQEYVEEECDKLEYDGSMMFDEYPDRLTLHRICDRIYEKAMNSSMETQNVTQKAAKNVGSGQNSMLPGQRPPFPPGPGPRPPMPPGPGTRPPMPSEPPCCPMPPSPRNEMVRNLIEVLLYNEMYTRRCRYHRCRRWW